MIISLLKIIVSLGLLVGVMGGVCKLVKYLNIHAEVQRKIVHTSLGLYALTFPLIFTKTWEVAVLCGAAIILMVMIRLIPRLYASLGGGLHNVGRISLGEIFFAFSVGLLFVLKGDQPVFYVLPLLILTLSDAAAALVGTLYAKSSFRVEEGIKSWEGTTFFFLTAWILSLIALVTLSTLPREAIVPVSFVIAVFGTLIEATSWKGLDNLFVPIGLFLLLQNIAFLPLAHLLAISSTFIAVLCFSLWLARKLQIDLHAINTVTTAAFFFWVVGGWANLVAPLSVLAVHLFLRRNNEKDDLPVILAIISTGLFWYTISEIFKYNVYYVYNLSFSLHLVMLVLLRPELQRVIPFIVTTVLAWMVANVRILFVTDFQPRDLSLSLQALAIISIFAFATLILRRNFEKSRWLKQALAVLVVSSIGIPVSLWLS